MFKRNVYSKAEEETLNQWRARSEAVSGWIGDEPSVDFPYPVRFRHVTKEIIEHHAFTVDFKNPLYRNEEYARMTRWAGIIAPPFFTKSICSAGPFHWLAMPPEVAKLDTITIGEGFRFYKPIRPGDTFAVWCNPATIDDVTEDGKPTVRKYRIIEEIKYLNQRDELVAIGFRDNVCSFVSPEEDYGKILRMGYEMATAFSVGKPADLGEIRQTPEWIYHPTDVPDIDKVYDNEVRRGKEIRYWEDVEVGEELHPIVMGPITTWDAAMALATFGLIPMPMMEVRKRTPHEVFVDPETGIPHKSIEMHLNPRVAQLVSFYSPTIIETIIQGFLGRLITNWMGDDGFMTYFVWKKMANTNFGDTILGRGKVIRKYVDEEGRCLVDLHTWMETQRGFISNLGPATVSLLSKALISEGKPPVNPDLTAPSFNPANIQAGDKVRIKPRPDWELSSGYNLNNETATVFEMADEKGFAFLLMDNDVTGLDMRVPLGFRLDALEKI